MPVDFSQIALGLVGGGGVAGIASVIQNARANRVTVKVEENKTAIDGFDRLASKLEGRIAAAEAEHEREMVRTKAEHDREMQQLTADCAARCAVKDERIAELERRLKR